MAGRSKEKEVSSIVEIRAEIASVYVLGVSPLIVHGFSESAERELLLPGRKKNKSERETTLKHNPREEFRGCLYEAPDDAPTAIVVPASAFNSAIRNAALRVPGATKTEIGQLVHVVGEWVPIYGIPLLDIRPIRNAGVTKTPDMRTRPFVARWCAKFDVRYIMPITSSDVGKLCAAAGIIMGVGDGRPEKGAMDFGQFKLVGEDDREWRIISNAYGKKEQLKAIANPDTYNAKSQRLLSWYDSEVGRRELVQREPRANGSARNGKRQENGVAAHS